MIYVQATYCNSSAPKLFGPFMSASTAEECVIALAGKADSAIIVTTSGVHYETISLPVVTK